MKIELNLVMDNSKEVQRLFKEAQEDLLRSKKTFEINDFVDAVHNAQLSIEKLAKSVIAEELIKRAEENLILCEKFLKKD